MLKAGEAPEGLEFDATGAALVTEAPPRLVVDGDPDFEGVGVSDTLLGWPDVEVVVEWTPVVVDCG